METVKIKISSEEESSRVELFVRIAWAFLCSFVLYFFGLVAGLALIFQAIHILVTEKRHMGANAYLNSFVTAYIGLYAYIYLLTDERPPIIPKF